MDATSVERPLLERVAAGDRAAVSACIDRYGPLVGSMARRWCGSRTDEAEDAVQDIFVSLWRSAGSYRPELASEPTFVAMIARRRLVDRVRQRGARPEPGELPEDLDSPDAAPTEQAELADEAERARRALEALPEASARILKLAVWGGLSHSEIAERTGLPLGTVKSHARRGLARLRELLSRDGPSGGEEPS